MFKEIFAGAAMCSHPLYGRAESRMISCSKLKLQVLKLLYVPKVRK
jgi:hypothetical protein